MAGGPFSYISSFFGNRKRFRTSNGNWSSSFHGGIDLPAAEGAPVPAMEDGIVEQVVHHPKNGYGNYVVLKHADGSKTLYAHLSSFGDIQPGMAVKKGTRLGGVGSTGNSTGNHLHFTYFDKNGEKINPLLKYSLDDFNRLAMQGTAANQIASSQTADKAYTSAHYTPSPTWWQLHMPSILGGYTDEQKAAYKKQQQLDREIFTGVTARDLVLRGVSEDTINRMEEMSHSIAKQNALLTTIGKSGTQITYKMLLQNNYSKEEAQAVIDAASAAAHKNQSGRA